MTNHYLLERLLPRDPNLRASDAEREQVADRLRKGHAEGRLDMAEFQQRVESCYQAKTIGALGELVGDLPRPDNEDQPSRGGLGLWHWGWAPLPLILFGLVALSGISAAGHTHHVFWLWLPLLFLFWRVGWWRRRRWRSGAWRSRRDWIER